MTKISMSSKPRIKGNRGPIFIGEAPNRDGHGPVLYGETFGPMCGHSASWWYRRVRRCNVLRAWPGPRRGRGSAFPMDAAVESAEALLRHLDGQQVVCLGKRVQRALGAPQAPYCVWRSLIWPTMPSLVTGDPITADVAIFPHPSGVNRWWDDAENRRQATLFMRNLLL